MNRSFLRCLAALVIVVSVAACGSTMVPTATSGATLAGSAAPASSGSLPASLPPPAPETFVPATAVATGSADPFYPDRIPRVLNGVPVLRPTPAASFADATTDSTPFLVGGWTSGAPPISCPTAFPRPALAPSCMSGLYWLGEAPGLQGLWGRLFNPANLSLPQTGAVVLRVHTHDPLASECPAEFRKQCDAAMIIVAVEWGDEAAAASPTPVPSKPYHLAFKGVDHLIRERVDCAFLVSPWLHGFCLGTLLADWQAIAIDEDPTPQSDTWSAAMARAQMDGDLSICDDVRMRTWMSAPTMGGAPQPGASATPGAGPIAECRRDLSNPPRPGVIAIEDPTAKPKAPISVTVVYPPPTFPVMPARAFVPAVICPLLPYENPSAAACAQVVDALAKSPDLGPASITIVGVHSELLGCAPALPCPTWPPDGVGLHSVVVGYADGRTLQFNAVTTGGRIVFVEIPTGGASPTPSH